MPLTPITIGKDKMQFYHRVLINISFLLNIAIVGIVIKLLKVVVFDTKYQLKNINEKEKTQDESLKELKLNIYGTNYIDQHN